MLWPRYTLMIILTLMPAMICPAGKFANQKPGGITGMQPHVAIDKRNQVHLVYGLSDTIFHRISRNGGKTFTPPGRVATIRDRHPGPGGGPQIVALGNLLVISAAGKDGNLNIWRSADDGDTWQGPVRINRIPGQLPDGFHGIAGGREHELLAAWLAKSESGLKIAAARSRNGGATWEGEQTIFESPEGVCECCQPAVAGDKEGRFAVMWRNNLNGNRDMYYTLSTDGGEIFGEAVQLGKVSWPLNACPVDGGDIVLTPGGGGKAVWQRNGKVFLSTSGNAEKELGTGKHPVIINQSGKDYVAWENAGRIKLLKPDHDMPEDLGPGSYPRMAAGPGSESPPVLVFETQKQSNPSIVVIPLE